MKRMLLVLIAVAIIAALMATSAYAQITSECLFDDQGNPWSVDQYGNWIYCKPW